MPYIKNRDRFDIEIEELLYLVQTTESIRGQLNYIITRIVHRYIELEIAHGQTKNYDLLSNGKSILSDALDEYKRQILDKYEDKKKQENGCISELDK